MNRIKMPAAVVRWLGASAGGTGPAGVPEPYRRSILKEN